MTTEPMTQVALDERPWRGPEDTAAMAALANAVNAAEGVDEHVDVDGLTNWLAHDDAQFIATRDVILFERDGQLVAYGWTFWVDTTDGLREHRLGGYVHPDWQRRGIGTRLLHRLEEMARAALAAYPTERPVHFGSFADGARVAKQALLQREGFTVVRWFFEMRRDLHAEITVPPLPEGLEVRPVAPDRAVLRQLFDADSEAFQDHWGGFAATDARFAEWMGDPDFDPSLFVVAWDGDEIAGASINAIYRHENEAFARRRGWLDSVFVRRPWRRRGLAGALVARSLVVLREAAMDEGWLGVDAENPTGALGVYERAGFEIAKRHLAYRRPMAREGNP